MRWIACLLLTCSTWLGAADSSALADFQQALNSEDYQAKKSSLSKLPRDDSIIPALLGALGDRQIGERALDKLKSVASGLLGAPPSPSGRRLTGELIGEWRQWHSAYQTNKQALAEAAKLEEQLQKLQEQQDGSDDPATAVSDGTTTGAGTGGEEKTSYMQPETDLDLGKLDRIFFNDGSIMSCYIMLKRRDLNGNLTSIKVMHKNHAGTQTIESRLISHIDEDYRN